MRKTSACSSTLKQSRSKKKFIKCTQWLKQTCILSIFVEELSLTLSLWRINVCLTRKVQKYNLSRKIIEHLATMLLLKRSFKHTKLPFKIFVSILTYLCNRSYDKMNNRHYKPWEFKICINVYINRIQSNWHFLVIKNKP